MAEHATCSLPRWWHAAAVPHAAAGVATHLPVVGRLPDDLLQDVLALLREGVVLGAKSPAGGEEADQEPSEHASMTQWCTHNQHISNLAPRFHTAPHNTTSHHSPL